MEITHPINGCTEYIEIELSEPAPLEIDYVVSDYNGYGISCPNSWGNDGFIDVTVTGGNGYYFYYWTAYDGGSIPSGQEDNQDLNNLNIGSYNLIVTDEFGSGSSINVELTAPEQLEAFYETSNYNGYGVSCQGAEDGFINIIITGGIENEIYSQYYGELIYEFYWYQDGILYSSPSVIL